MSQEQKPKHPLAMRMRGSTSLVVPLAGFWRLIVRIWSILIIGIIIGILGNAIFTILSTGTINLTGTKIVIMWLSFHFPLSVTILTTMLIVTLCSYFAHHWKLRQIQENQYAHDEALVAIAKGIQQSLDELMTKKAFNHRSHSPPVSVIEESLPPTKIIWKVPYRRNPFFTGREDILAHLNAALQQGKAVALTQPQAISGLGGIGKTQIAVEYVYRYRDQYQTILWINASSRETTINDFVILAELQELPEQHEQDQDIFERAVRRWLTTHSHWLLILDGLDDPKMISAFLPADITGNVLITTRIQALGTFAQCIEIEKMSLEEGMIFLLHRSKILSIDAPLDQLTKESQSQAVEIVIALEGLPLALDQAGAYIEETHCDLSQYLYLYHTRRKELLMRRGRFPMDHPDSVSATWSLSFQQVEQKSPAAADLLRLFAFLDSEAIPDEIIIQGTTELGSSLKEIENDTFKLDTLVELLLRYSLIRRNSELKLLSIHRLVQAVIKDSMDKDTQHKWAERAIRAVNKIFPEVDQQSWERCQRYLPQVNAFSTLVDEHGLNFPEVARLMNEAGKYLIVFAHYSQAKLLLEKALKIREQILKGNHPDIARTLNDLGGLYRATGSYSDAEQFLLKALNIQERVLGHNHPDVAQTLYNLARVYRAQGKYKQAEPFYLQALEIRKKTLGVDHPLVALSYYGLAKLYYALELYKKAEKFCKQALHIQEKSLGDSDTMIASSLTVLAKIYLGQNKLVQAEELLKRALLMRESISGENHPHIAIILTTLVQIYHAEGRYHEAEPLIARASRIHIEAFGSEHVYNAYSLSCLAENFFLQGDYSQAEYYYKEAERIRQKNLGPDHPRTASTYNDLAKFYSAIKRYEEAKVYYQKALTILKGTFEADRLTVSSLLEQYATVLKKIEEKESGK